MNLNSSINKIHPWSGVARQIERNNALAAAAVPTMQYLKDMSFWTMSLAEYKGNELFVIDTKGTFKIMSFGRSKAKAFARNISKIVDAVHNGAGCVIDTGFEKIELGYHKCLGITWFYNEILTFIGARA
jgi:hypothetical protein